MNSGEKSEISLKDISERFNIPYQTVRRHAAAHDWHGKRYSAWIQETYGMSPEEHRKALYREIMNNG